jgi:hypothetical protein
MSSRSPHERANSEPVIPSDELPSNRLHRLVRQDPLLVVGAAGAVGGVLGGILFSRLGRLLFSAAVGYVANELWHREGRLDIARLVEEVSSPPESGGATRSPPESGGAIRTPPSSGGTRKHS